MSIERFSPDGEGAMEVDSLGAYVNASDYFRLERDNAALRMRVKELLSVIASGSRGGWRKHKVTTSPNQIRLKISGESFWAFKYDDLPPNQAEINNHLLTDKYSYGDRVEFDEDRNVIRLVKTQDEVKVEMQQKNGGEKSD